MTGNSSSLARRARLGNWAVTSMVAFGLVACGGSPPAATKAPAKEEAAPKTIEEAQDQIDAARAAIEQTFAEAPASGGVAAEKADGGAADPAICGRQCKALTSMKRAVDAVCRMAGDTESRCTSAKRTFDASARRISATHCACTEAL